MEKLVWAWTNLKAIGFFPEVTIVGMAIYFVMRFFLEKDKLTSIYAILAVNLLGQLYYDFPKNIQDAIGSLFFTAGQMAVAIALYSFLEAIGALEIAKRFMKKKADDAGIPKE